MLIQIKIRYQSEFIDLFLIILPLMMNVVVIKLTF